MKTRRIYQTFCHHDEFDLIIFQHLYLYIKSIYIIHCNCSHWGSFNFYGYLWIAREPCSGFAWMLKMLINSHSLSLKHQSCRTPYYTTHCRLTKFYLMIAPDMIEYFLWSLSHANLDFTGKPLSRPSVFKTPTERHKTTPNTPGHHLNELNDQMARCLLQNTRATYLMAAFTLYPVAQYGDKACLPLLPSPPLPCTHIAPAWAGPEYDYLSYICHQVVV